MGSNAERTFGHLVTQILMADPEAVVERLVSFVETDWGLLMEDGRLPHLVGVTRRVMGGETPNLNNEVNKCVLWAALALTLGIHDAMLWVGGEEALIKSLESPEHKETSTLILRIQKEFEAHAP